MLRSVLAITLSALVPIAFAQPVAQDWTASVQGVWKGTSLCQVKESACHDEVAVYHVAHGPTDGQLVFTMNKVVDGKELEMGLLDCSAGERRGMLTCKMSEAAIWSFLQTGDEMTGTLVYHGQLFRKIQLTRAK